MNSSVASNQSPSAPFGSNSPSSNQPSAGAVNLTRTTPNNLPVPQLLPSHDKSSITLNATAGPNEFTAINEQESLARLGLVYTTPSETSESSSSVKLSENITPSSSTSAGSRMELNTLVSQWACIYNILGLIVSIYKFSNLYIITLDFLEPNSEVFHYRIYIRSMLNRTFSTIRFAQNSSSAISIYHNRVSPSLASFIIKNNLGS